MFVFSSVIFAAFILVGFIPKNKLVNNGWKEYIISLAAGFKICIELVIKTVDPPTLVGSLKMGILFQDSTMVFHSINSFPNRKCVYSKTP